MMINTHFWRTTVGNIQARKRLYIGVLTGAAFSAVCVTMPAVAQVVPGGCGELMYPGQYGPYDYRTDPNKVPVVLRAHFSSNVEYLRAGQTNKTPGPDLDYTLRALPNYPRALIAIVKLGVKEKTQQPIGSRYTVECWLKRAIAFRSNDVIVRLIYADYLYKNIRMPEALYQLSLAEAIADDNPLSHYNIGLHYFDFKEFDKSLAEAHRALALGWTGVELRNMLEGVGKWIEPKDLESGVASPEPKPPKLE